MGITTSNELPKGYVPPKDWEELTSDEKIERMREIIKQYSNELSRVQISLHNCRKNLKNHIHFNDKVMITKEAQEYDDNSSGLVGETAKLSNAKFF